MPAFDRFPKEAAIIGRILAGYTDLEIGMMHCVQVATDDFDTTMKVMFRTRGESQRIQIADAMGRHVYEPLKLRTQFEMAISAVRKCLVIRNQYAHCVWWDDNSGKLAFANMEDIATLNDHQSDLSNLPAHHVDVPLLAEQQNYFEYASISLAYVNYEGRFRAKKLQNQPVQKPKQIEPPANYV